MPDSLESAKLHGLHGSVGCMGQIFTWVAGLHGSKYFLHGSTFYVGDNFYVVCMGPIYLCMGQIFFAWVQIFLCGSLRGSKFFTWVQNFCDGQLLFTRRDCFTTLQLIA